MMLHDRLPVACLPKTKTLTRVVSLSLCLLLSGVLPTVGSIASAGTIASIPAGVTKKRFVEEGPQFLTFPQLHSLATDPKHADALKDKLDAILNKPFIYKNPNIGPMAPKVSNDPAKPPSLRVASWNIERGFKLDQIIDLFQSELPSNMKAGREQTFDNAKKEAEWLSQSDIIVLNEVDLGMNRTSYRNVAKEMANALDMHAVYGVEFLELTPLYVRDKLLQEKAKAKKAGKKKPAVVKPTNAENPSGKPKHVDGDAVSYNADAHIDTHQYKGLHGSAILSKYPILNVEVVRLPNVYDWYTKERQKLSQLEGLKRQAADMIFLEDVLTEIRYGSRMALVVDVSVPELPEKKATIVCVHLENRVQPIGRRKQMQYLLDKLRDRHNPVVIAGDLNSTGTDSSPTSIKKEVRKLVTSSTFWFRRAVNLLAPYSTFITLAMQTSQFTKNLFDPTAPDIPLIAPNKEHYLFDDLRTFRFSDGTVFDTRGKGEYAYNDRKGLLANSNQRWMKGFVPTFSFERPIAKGLFGRYKLDWIFVKNYMVVPPMAVETQKQKAKVTEQIKKATLEKQAALSTTNPKTQEQNVTGATALAATDTTASDTINPQTTEPASANDSKSTKKAKPSYPYLFAPTEGRTLSNINALFGDKLSDHSPITVDLLLAEPPPKPPEALEPIEKSATDNQKFSNKSEDVTFSAKSASPSPYDSPEQGQEADPSFEQFTGNLLADMSDSRLKSPIGCLNIGSM